MKRAVAVIALLIANAISAAEISAETCGMLNGRGWKVLGLTTKAFYLRGVLDGMLRGSERSPVFSASYHFPEGDFSYEEIAASLDGLFAKPENSRIKVIDGLQIITMKFNGKEPAAVEAATARERRLAAVPCSVEDRKAK